MVDEPCWNKHASGTCNFNIEAMDALRTAISFQSHCDVDSKDSSREANIRKAIKLIATTGRPGGATTAEFSDYVMETISDPGLDDRWEGYQS
jgi:hypothetical protein